LASAGYRVIVPYIRGYGSTRFLSSETMRNGQPSAVAVDMIALMDALKIEKPILAGFDWGARTGDIIAAVWPERCKALVSVSGYLIGSQESGRMPLPPSAELQWWYQFYFATDRGRDGYDKYRHDFSKLIWRLASPKWNFDDATYDRSAAAFENPDHVSVVIHNYRWRLGLAEGEAKYDNMEKRLAESPAITVPTITLEGDANGAPHSEPSVCSGRISNDQLNELLLVRIIVKSGIRSSDYQFVDEGHAYECSACTHKRGQVTNDSPIGRFRTEAKRWLSRLRRTQAMPTEGLYAVE
jgi:pimeloyl-ACP methyl ester carboxylesterase